MPDWTALHIFVYSFIIGGFGAMCRIGMSKQSVTLYQLFCTMGFYAIAASTTAAFLYEKIPSSYWTPVFVAGGIGLGHIEIGKLFDRVLDLFQRRDGNNNDQA
jgi:hypothetical protein